jgi:2-polyprenyl-3-methyl-5-hydroxy-6-metoxy-1,4-benzoquinol methylase
MTNSLDVIKASHDLNGDPDSLQKYYQKWASEYNSDVANEDYLGPDIIATLADLAIKGYLDTRKSELQVLDAGCGTGLAGVALNRARFNIIDGNDLSQAMIDQARRTNAYRLLEGGVDLDSGKLSSPHALYDLVVCCGVFTLGHVSPYAMYSLANYTKIGGILIVSTRNSYLRSTEFKSVSAQICKAGILELLAQVEDASYITEERAHYWLYRVRRNDAPPPHTPR